MAYRIEHHTTLIVQMSLYGHFPRILVSQKITDFVRVCVRTQRGQRSEKLMFIRTDFNIKDLGANDSIRMVEFRRHTSSKIRHEKDKGDES
jgi:hypothetical protein